MPKRSSSSSSKRSSTGGNASKSRQNKPKPPSDSALKKIDKELVRLLNERTDATLARFLDMDEPRTEMFGAHQDPELLKRLDSLATGTLPIEVIRTIYKEIISAARQQVRSQRAAYLGPAFSFTHLAAIERFGTKADLIPVNTIAAVFDEVNRGHVEFGIVPIENTTDGRIVDTLDMFQRLPLRICGEVQISVHHNLLSRSPRSEITEIYSKPQALSQCRDWLARNMPDVRLIEVTSTSTAAQLARDKPGAAAVASRQAAVQYDLEIIADNIEDNPNNITRFAIIGDETTLPTGNDRTALLLQIPHSPGALADVLSVFKKNKINLTWIESFPLRGVENGYMFFLDFEGHANEAKIKRTLNELSKHAVSLREIGSYPRSEPSE